MKFFHIRVQLAVIFILRKKFIDKLGKEKLIEADLRQSLRNLACLPFFPIDKVIPAFEFIANLSPEEFRLILQYF